MKDREGKFTLISEKLFKIIPAALMVLSLCAICFYFGGILCSQKSEVLMQSGFSATDMKQVACRSQVDRHRKFEECNITFQDLTPCMDPARWSKYDKHRKAFRERHCPSRSERMNCLIPPPKGYKIPIRWPRSRDECWYRNVPYDWINTVKADQRWMQKKGEKFIFPGGGTMFSKGVNKYLDLMEELIPQLKDGTVRTALDTGCGVASWGGYLQNRGVITMSLAPRDNHEAQVQFALERGIPAMLGIISTQRLPYPANAFDMAHCSRCLIPWTIHGGVNLLEVDRVLRPGGFWVLSGPPVNYQHHWKGWATTKEKQKLDLDRITDLLNRMCYKLYAMKGDLAVWQKPLDDICYSNRENGTLPPFCDGSIDPDDSWYVPVQPCIVRKTHKFSRLGVGQTPKWPDRLKVAPERCRFFSGGSEGGFKKDSRLWVEAVKYYKAILPALGTNKIRNVMDMNTRYGGFAAALVKEPVWVMNVVSAYAVNSLGVIYDRGLIGTINDWCEAFSTYPRTYDLLHADNLFTLESHRCDMKFILLEMDRILRPDGYVILREEVSFMYDVLVLGEAMRWQCKRHPTERTGNEKEIILICQKPFWQSSQLIASESGQ